MRAGINDLVVVRLGDTVHALHAVCAHAGGPLDRGHDRRRLRRVPVARLALPAERRARPPGPVASTTSRATRSAPPKAAATRCAGAPWPSPARHAPVSTLVLPDPSLVVLIGAAGSGKSTLAARLFAPGRDPVIGRPARRGLRRRGRPARLGRRPSGILHKTLDRRLAAGAMTVVDATNTKAEHRRPLHRAGARDRHPRRGDRPGPADRDRPGPEREANGPRRRPDRGRPAPRRGPPQRRPGRLTTEGFDHVVVLRSPTERRPTSAVERRKGRPAPASRPRRRTGSH